jgi:hypothetical protein
MSDRTIESVFNPRRLFLLLRRDFVNGYRGLLIAMAAVGGTILVISILSMIGGRQREFYTPFFVQMLFLAGFIYTSLAFKEMHQNASGSFYLTLPGTTLEKLASKLLSTSLGFAIGAVIYMTVVSAVSELVVRAIFGTGHDFFNPLSRDVLLSVAVYLVMQSIFLLGSVWFKKLAFLKTSLAMFVLFTALAIFAGVLMRLLFGEYFRGSELTPQAQAAITRYFTMTFPTEEAARLYMANGTIPLILKILFWGVMAPVCWVISYLRLSETEV